MRDRVNQSQERFETGILFQQIAFEKVHLTDTRKTLNLLLNKRSKTTNEESLNIDVEKVITENSDIARSINEFFCSMGRNLNVKIPQQPNPLCQESTK